MLPDPGRHLLQATVAPVTCTLGSTNLSATEPRTSPDLRAAVSGRNPRHPRSVPPARTPPTTEHRADMPGFVSERAAARRLRGVPRRLPDQQRIRGAEVGTSNIVRHQRPSPCGHRHPHRRSGRTAVGILARPRRRCDVRGPDQLAQGGDPGSVRSGRSAAPATVRSGMPPPKAVPAAGHRRRRSTPAPATGRGSTLTQILPGMLCQGQPQEAEQGQGDDHGGPTP